jgi:hypothetical protein
MITFKPTEIVKIKDFSPAPYMVPDDYRLFIFDKGAEAISTTYCVMEIENAEILFKLFNSGKLTNAIPYDELWKVFLDNIKMNGSDYGLTAQIFGIVISEICRSSANVKVPFCHTDIKSMNSYKPISVKEIPKYVSPAAAITSENFDEGIVNAIMNKSPKETPMEKILMEEDDPPFSFESILENDFMESYE